MLVHAWGRPRRKFRRDVERILSIWLPLGLFIVVTLFPFYWMAITSVKPDRELYNVRAAQYWVVQPTFEHYIYLLTRTLYWRWLFNTMLISISATMLAVGMAILAGYALARLRFWGAAVFGTAIGISYLVPQSLLFIPMFDVIRAFGIGDTYLAMVLPYQTFLVPFCTFLLAGYFKSIPQELEECARIDGAGRIEALFRIVLPLAMPGIVSATIFSFTLCWNEYLYAMVFTTSSTMKTVPIGVVSELIHGDVFFWGSLMASAMLGSIPVVIVFAFFAEYYVAGLTAGAVKG
jgi:multiple sugar transport system permease protein